MDSLLAQDSRTPASSQEGHQLLHLACDVCQHDTHGAPYDVLYLMPLQNRRKMAKEFNAVLNKKLKNTKNPPEFFLFFYT
jgi:hypothetical protein